jgi:hypothetical protein
MSQAAALVVVAIALLAAAGPSGAAPAHEAGYWKRCRSHASAIHSLKAHKASCSGSRKMARRWYHRSSCHPAADPGGPMDATCHVRAGRARYTCYSSLDDDGFWDVDCLWRKRVVSFVAEP